MANQAAGTSLKQIGKIFKVISGFSGALSSANTLYQYLTDSTPTDRIVNAIKEMETVIDNELKKIEQQLAYQNWQNEWRPFEQKINSIQVSAANIASDFATLDKKGNDYIIRKSTDMDFGKWATERTDSVKNDGGALYRLYNDMKAVWDLFQSGGASNPSALDIWGHLFENAASNNIQNFSGQHRLSAYFMLLQQFNGIISQIYFLHEAVLALYSLHYGENSKFNSLSSDVERWFGSVSSKNTVWQMFDQMMTFNQPVFKDFNMVSTAVDSSSANDNNLLYVRAADPGSPCGSFVWIKKFSVQDLNMSSLGIKNAFITDIKLVNASNSSPDFHRIYLEGTVSTMLPGGGIELVGNHHSYDPSAKEGSEYLLEYPFPGYTGDDGGWYVSTGYSAPGSTTGDPNKFYVVTGFKLGLKTHGPNTTYYSTYLVIEVERAILDVSDINNPTVSGYTKFITADTDGTGFSFFGKRDENDPPVIPPDVEFWNLNSAGNAAGFPIDDISLSRVHNVPYQWNGNETGLLARSNFTIHRADFMQPIHSLVPHGYNKTNS